MALSLLLKAAFCTLPEHHISKAPNVVLLWVDDVGYGDVGFNGNTTLRTPHLDSLAASGVILTQHLVASPICTPSRAALMTGRHAVRSGMTSGNPNFYVMGLGPGSLPDESITLAESLRDRGYTTLMLGKWHLGGTADETGLPTRHGFQSYWGMPITNVQACRSGHKEYPHSMFLLFLIDRTPINRILPALGLIAITPHLFGMYRRWKYLGLIIAVSTFAIIYLFTSHLTLLNPNACLLYQDEKPIEQPVELGYLTHRHTLRATKFIESAKPPFFLYLSYPNAHTAMWSMDENKGTSLHGPYGENVEELDSSIGTVMNALKTRGVRDDTFVYFASDNGPFREELDEGGSCGNAPVLSSGVPLFGLARDVPRLRSTKQLKGAKGQTWECGLRVPALVSYPKRWAGGFALHAPTTAMDLMPTILSLAVHGQTGGDAAVKQGGPMPSPFHHVSELKKGEYAGVKVLDGKSFVWVLDKYAGVGKGMDGGADAAAERLATADKLEATAIHDVIFHYCGDRVSAVRLGRYKAHYTTARWEDDRQICRRNVICNCHGHEHNPPLLFDVHADPAELNPLDVNDAWSQEGSARRALLERIAHQKDLHEATLIKAPSQTERIPTSPFHLPCCGTERGSKEHAWQLMTGQCGC